MAGFLEIKKMLLVDNYQLKAFFNYSCLLSLRLSISVI